MHTNARDMFVYPYIYIYIYIYIYLYIYTHTHTCHVHTHIPFRVPILELPGHGLATAADGAAIAKNAGDAMDGRV